MRTLIASNDDALSESIRQELLRNGHDAGSCQIARFDGVVHQISEIEPDLIVLVLQPDQEQGRALLVELRRLLAVPILVFGPANDPKFILHVLREGGTEYLDAADSGAELHGALERLQVKQTKREVVGKTVTVVSACGGAGASTIATNLATVLAGDCKKSLLVDLVLETGVLASLLNLHPTYSLADLCQVNGLIDRGMVERSLAKHENGVHLLASPRAQDRFITLLYTAEAAPPTIDAASLRQALALSRFMFPYIIIDHSPTFSEAQVQAMHMADVMLIVLRLEFAALRNAQRLLEHTDRLGLPREKIRLIANRHGQPKEVPVEKAAEALKMPFFHMIPDDAAAINRANNFGVPVAIDAPRSKVATSFRELAQKIRGVK